MGDINQIKIGKTGSDGWCIESFSLEINGQQVSEQNFDNLPNDCKWLDNENGHSLTHTVSHSALRAHPDWPDYNHAEAIFALAFVDPANSTTSGP